MVELTSPHASGRVFARVLSFCARHWRRHPGAFAAAVLCILAATAVDIVLPVIAGRMVDAVAGGLEHRDSAIAAVAAMIALGAVYVALRDLAIRAVIRLTTRNMQAMAQEAFARVQRFASDWHAGTFAGATVRKVTRGMWAIDMLNDTVVIGLLPAAMVLLGATAMLAWRWPVMGAAVALGSGVFLVLSLGLMLRYVSPAERRANAMDSTLGGKLADAIGCNAVVKSFGAEAREDGLIARTLDLWRARTLVSWHRQITVGTGQQYVMLALNAAVLTIALWLWSRGEATPGDVTYVFGTYALIHGYLRDIGNHVRNLQRAVNDLEDLVEYAERPLGVADRPDAPALAITEGRIELDRVTFRYPGQAQPIYRDFSLVIAPGERIGLVGQSGSGKSTFVKLVQRLHDLDGGRILIDSQDIAAITQESLRRQVALVPQDPVLFHRSLRENIAYGRPDASLAEVVAAAREAHAHEFIARLPHGYETAVGERGVKLSGGERQRVALARAILADAPILILDEATSSLDSVSEALIQDAVERLIAGRTTIVVAHRLSTVQRVDRILVFDQGRIVEQGSHAELVRREGGHYRALFERQALGLVGTRDAA